MELFTGNSAAIFMDYKTDSFFMQSFTLLVKPTVSKMFFFEAQHHTVVIFRSTWLGMRYVWTRV